jgi:hypothetical protein
MRKKSGADMVDVQEHARSNGVVGAFTNAGVTISIGASNTNEALNQ